MANHYQQKEKTKMPQIPNVNLKEYVKGNDKTEALKFAEEFGKYLQSNEFSTTKLRGVFGEIDKILNIDDSQKMKGRIALLKPKLAYLKGRENRWTQEVVENFKKVIEIMIDELLQNEENLKEHYKNFVNFVKAIVSYHKYNGGK